MNMHKYALGLDFGTLSARAVLLDLQDGKISVQSVYAYPHGVMDRELNGQPLPSGYALQHPQDYLTALRESVHGVMKESGILPEQIIGIGLDFTSATILPVNEELVPLCMTEEFRNEPHAYVKLWKHHGAEAEAEYIDRIAKERKEVWLTSHGNKVSSEWTIPKVLETMHHAPAVYRKARYFLEAMDWLTSCMTGKVSASLCGVGYKMLYHQGHFPDPAFFASLDPALSSFIADKFPNTILPIGSCAGTLTDTMAEQLGLCPGIPIGTAIIDAHSSVPGCGIHQAGDLMIIMGTSSCHMLLTENDAEIRGIQGIVRDGILPGFYGIEAGQPCTGDLLAWVVENCLPESYIREAQTRKISGHQLLTDKLYGYHAGESGLLALDWFNGVRTPLMDFDLSGLILGLNLQTKPEEIYLSMIEATAYGTRLIIEEFENSHVPVHRIILSGGIPSRNPLVAKIYADILNRPVITSDNMQASAAGAAMLGIAAAPKEITGYHDLNEITAALGSTGSKIDLPDPAQAEIYDRLYEEYRRLYRYFGEGSNNLMHMLAALRHRH